ncbi:MAG: aldose 1-epimerase family protein [Candidatus Dormibacteraeota bacterium]|nr:aldose 1-epimerase family protein [Candidatus Dormibacteraeota bacterium]
MNPSGDQVDLRHGAHHAVIVEVSGGIRSYEVDGQSLVDGYAAGEMCTGARGQLLVPWPNRLRDGRYDFDGETFQVPLSEPDKMNAIHGFLRWEPWAITARSDDRVVMEHTLHPRAGYPFALHMAVEYRLDDQGLSCTPTATNVGERSCPYAFGVHPYLHVGTEPFEQCWLEAPAQRYLVNDERAIPTGAADVAGTRYDFRSRRQIAGAVVDTAFLAPDRDDRGRAWVRLWNARQDRGVGLWMDERFPYYMLFTGDTLPEVDRRRQSIGVEPMTCAPNAFASGDGLITLAPGESSSGAWGIAPLGHS